MSISHILNAIAACYEKLNSPDMADDLLWSGVTFREGYKQALLDVQEFYANSMESES